MNGEREENLELEVDLDPALEVVEDQRARAEREATDTDDSRAPSRGFQ